MFKCSPGAFLNERLNVMVIEVQSTNIWQTKIFEPQVNGLNLLGNPSLHKSLTAS